MTSKFTKTWLSLNTTARLYSLALQGGMIGEEPGSFMKFHDLWMKSVVYELPCGYIRFEEYPLQRATTVHGIFDANPYYHTQLILEVLDYYLENANRIDRLECHIPKQFKGLNKMVSSLARTSIEEGDKTVHHYWRS